MNKTFSPKIKKKIKIKGLNQEVSLNQFKKIKALDKKKLIAERDNYKSQIKALEKGVKIEDYVSGKAKVKILKIDEEKDVSRIEIIIHEGKNREVRKMCNAIGKKVLALHRSRIGNLNVKDLKIGEWKYLNNKQIESLIK